MPKTSAFKYATRLALLGIVISPTVAFANMGIPFSVIVVGMYWMLLVTVIVVEAIVLWTRLSLKPFKALGVSALANIASAILGTVVFPLAESMADMAGFDMYDPWTSKTLFFLFLVPNYLLSVWLEVLIAMKFIKYRTYGDIVRVFYTANIYSYLLLAVLVILIPLPIG